MRPNELRNSVEQWIPRRNPKRDGRVFFAFYDRLRANELSIATNCTFGESKWTFCWKAHTLHLAPLTLELTPTHVLMQSGIINQNARRTKRFCIRVFCFFFFRCFHFLSLGIALALHSRRSGKWQPHTTKTERKIELIYIYLRRICISSAHFHILWMY